MLIIFGFGRIKKLIIQNKEKKSFLKKNPGVYLGKNVKLKLPNYIKCGLGTVIGEDSKLLCTDKYNGEKFFPIIHIGRNFHATRRLTIQCANKVNVGNDVLVASDVFIIDYNHGTNPLSNNYLENSLELSPGVNLEDGVWIGNNVIILGGVTIGKKSIIGAGSVVTHDIPSYSIAVGNPAKVIKTYDFEKEEWVLNRK